MKQNIINYLNQLIAEHKESNFCTSYKEATNSIECSFDESFDKFYDVGRYDTLQELLFVVKEMEN